MAKIEASSKDSPAGEQGLDGVLQQIEKRHGKGAIMRMGEQPIAQIEGISTGSISLDLALGGRGLPRGRIVEVYGPESSGKTTLTLHVIANAQKAGGIAAFIDAEHALDPSYAGRLGVKLDELLISQPESGEQALDIAETLVRSNAVDVIVIDSVAALVPKAEIDGEMGDSFVGLQARLMSQALRKLTGATATSRTCLIFINQLREKIGVMFGNPETTTGGRALKFYSSVRIDIRRIGQVKDGEEVVGSRTKATVTKNKIAPPFRHVEFDILYSKGISLTGDLLDMGVEKNVIKKSGTWLTYGDIKLGQGRERARELLEDNAELTAKIRKEILEAAMPKTPAAGAAGAAGATTAPAASHGTSAGATAASGAAGARPGVTPPAAAGPGRPAAPGENRPAPAAAGKPAPGKTAGA